MLSLVSRYTLCMINILSKLPNVGNTIFSTMSQLATVYDAINLSQGFPDYNCSPKLSSLLSAFTNDGYNQYAPMQGVLPLREQIALIVESQHRVIYHPETEITITAGATQAIFTAISSVVRQDDEVICFDPAYDCYAPAVDLCGGIVKTVVQDPDTFLINWDDVRKVFSHKTKLIIVNTPQNPTGRTLKEEDIQQLIKLTKGTDIFIVSDEVYEHVIFDQQKHLSICAYPELKERSFIIGSFGKTLHITGWKVGFCLAPKKLMAEFIKIHQYLVFSVNTPAQWSISAYIKDPDSYLAVKDFFQQKRDFFIAGLRNSGFNVMPSEGTYFLLANYQHISELDDLTFTRKLIQVHQVAAVPLSAFYRSKLDKKNVRFCFAKKQETLEKAIEKLIAVKQVD